MKKITLFAIFMMAVCFITKGEPTNYLTFNGDDQYVDIPTTDDFRMTSEQSLSFSFWAYTTNKDDNARIFANRYSQTKDGSFDIFVGAYYYAVMFLSQDGSDPINAFIGGSENAWVHITTVCDRENGDVITYVNGVESETGTLQSTDEIVTTVNTTLGTSLNNTGELDFFLNGSIGNMRFYRGALTPTQVTVDMNANSYEALPTGLKDICTVAYDLTNQLQSTTLVDQTGRGNDGTLINYDAAIPAPERTITLLSSNEIMGTVSGGGTVEGWVTCTAIPNEGYGFINWTNQDGEVVSTDLEYQNNVEGDQTLTANFAAMQTVNSAAGENGSISPEGDQQVVTGGSITYQITPDAHYRISQILQNTTDITTTLNGSITTGGTVTIDDVQSFTMITVIFEELCSPNAIQTPYMETFDSEDVMDCWSVINVNDDYKTWQYSGNRLMYPYASTVAANDWVISPKLAIAENLKLVFDVSTQSASYPEKFSVYALTEQDDIENAVEILGTTTKSTTAVETMIVDLADFVGEEIYIGFKCESAANMYNLFIDNVGVIAPNYTVSAVADGEGLISINGAEASESQTVEVAQGDQVVFSAVANDGFEFLNWSDADGNEVSTANPYIVEETMDHTSIIGNFGLAEERTVEISVNDNTLGEVSFLTPEIEGSYSISLTTKQHILEFKAAPISDDAFFINWTDANGEEYSTSESIVYSGVEDLTLTANFEARYVITITKSAGGSLSVIDSYGVSVTSGDRATVDTYLSLNIVPQDVKEVGTITVNGEDITSQYVGGENLQVLVTGEMDIDVEFKDPDVYLSYSATGAGYVEVWSDDDGNPAGEKYTNGGAIPYNDPLYIFPYNLDGAALLTLKVNGEDYTNDYIDGLIDGYLSLEYYPVSNIVVEAAFSGESTGIEDATSSEAKVYGTSGAIVISGEGVATVYSLTGAAVKTVAVDGEATVSLQQGIYIVTINGKSYKAVVK